MQQGLVKTLNYLADHYVDISQGLAFFAMATFFVILTGFVFKYEDILINIESTSKQLNVTTTNLNNPLGTMYFVNRDAKDLRTAIDNFNSASIDERVYFEKTIPSITTQLQNILTNTNTFISDSDVTLNQTIPAQLNTDIMIPLHINLMSSNTAINAVTKTFRHVDNTFDAVDNTFAGFTSDANQLKINLQDADTIEKDPNWIYAAANANKAANNLNITLTNAADISKQTDKWAHPLRTIGNGIKSIFTKKSK